MFDALSFYLSCLICPGIPMLIVAGSIAKNYGIQRVGVIRSILFPFKFVLIMLVIGVRSIPDHIRGRKTFSLSHEVVLSSNTTTSSQTDMELEKKLLEGNEIDAEIPTHAKERLLIMSGQTEAKEHLFTSDLSVNEFLLTKESGFEPLGLVMGSSIYHVGFQVGKYYTNHELHVLSQARYHARELAMVRMEQEAKVLKADGIIGVRLTVTNHAWGSDLAEFMAVGTAVRAIGEKLYPDALGRPFTSDLSGQDFWTLLHAGYFPLELVMGTCVYHVAHQGIKCWFNQVGRNVEMSNYTQALYDAREIAMERMQAEAERLNAEGIVGARVEEEAHHDNHHIIEFFSIGTAIVSISKDHTISKPTVVLNANI